MSILLIFFTNIYITNNIKKKIIFYFVIYYISYNNFCKNISILLLNNHKYSNSFWDFTLILNNNNNSLLFCLVIYFIVSEGERNSYFKKTFIPITIIILFFLYSYNINLKDYLSIAIAENKINNNLINGLVLIHPIAIYVVYCYFILNAKIYNINDKRIMFLKKNLKNNNINTSFIGFSALFLGGLWSQQELNWGGWWNWDFVEIIALVFFLLSCLLIHVNNTKIINYFGILNTKIINYFILFFFYNKTWLNKFYP